MDFIGDKSKTSKRILLKSFQTIGYPDYIGSIDDCIKEIYKRFDEVGLKVDCMCYNCEAATVDINFCPFCGVDLDGPSFNFALSGPRHFDPQSVGGVGRRMTQDKETRVSGASLFYFLVGGIDESIRKEIELKYLSTVISFWNDYCKCFAKAFVGKWSIRILLPFQNDRFSMPDVPINLVNAQHNFASRLLVVANEEVDIARTLVLEAFVLKQEQRKRVLSAREGNRDVDLPSSNDDCNATPTSDGEQNQTVHIQEGAEVEGEGLANESSGPVCEEDHDRIETPEA